LGDYFLGVENKLQSLSHTELSEASLENLIVEKHNSHPDHLGSGILAKQ
jgi:hypothetical protein